MNGPDSTLAVDNNTSVTSRVGVGPVRKKQKTNMWCHYCDKNNHNMVKCREIAKAKQRKKTQYGSKAVPGKKALSFLFEEINAIKKQLKPQRRKILKR